MIDITAIGRAGVDLYSLDYNTPLQRVKKFAKYVGGTSANTMVGGARLGLKCALLTRVSKDELGDFVVDFLAGEGVITKYIGRDKNSKTGVVFAEVYPGKDSKFIFYRENAADLHLTKNDVKKELIEDTRSLIVTGTGLSAEPSYSANRYAMKLAKQSEKTTVFNLDWRPSLWQTSTGERVARYRAILGFADVVIGNEKEFMAATGRSSLEKALTTIPGRLGKILVVTHGENGCTIITKEGAENVKGFRVPFLKGLGGGDGFIAGFLFGHLKGWRHAQAATFGNAVGAIVVTGHACSESMPRLKEVADFLQHKGHKPWFL